MIRNVLHTLGSLRTALAAAVGVPFLIAVAAQGQTEATTERVIVTGTYIPTAESESALPVTVYTAEVLKKQGANTPVEGLRQLPSFVGNAATENDSNGGDGTATINLRAIGSANVLVLVNGRRTFNFLDINLIPIGATARTEVLKDGASSIYGSDAVAGVVNFILLNGPGEKPYEGAELFALYGNTTETDAHVRQVYLRGGVTGLDGKVSIAAEGEYYSRANLYSRDRFAVAGTANVSNRPTTDPHFGGGLGFGGFNGNSPTYAGRASLVASSSVKYPQYFSDNPAPGQIVLIDLSNNQVFPTSYRSFDPISGGGSSTDPSRYNFRVATPAIPAMEKAMYYVTGRYKIFGDGLQLYGDIMYSKAKQDNGLAAAPFSITNDFNGRVEARASQFNPFGNDLSSVRYRLVNDLGPRRSFFDKDAWRYVAGLNGDFSFKDNGFISHFSYDVGLVYERFDELRIDSGDATRSGLVNLISAGAFDIFIGQNAPVTGTAPIYNNTNSAAPQFRTGVPIGTAPYDNTIAGTSNFSTKTFQGQELQGASYIGHSEFYERDWMVDPKMNAHLFPNLWDGGWDFAIGYQHYHTAQHSVPDPVQAAGDQLGFNQAPNFKYQRDVDAVFVELGIPIVTSTMNVPFVRSLDIDIAWRREWFDDKDQYTHLTHSYTNENEDENFGGSPRVSLRYQPTPDLTLRASWGQSFRSGSLNAQFSPVAQNFPLVFDPFKTQTLQPPEGVWQGGNPDLKPERTDAYSAGLVYTPKWLPGFTMTMDWYQLFTRDLIVGAADFAQLMLTANGTDLKNGLPPRFVDTDGCGGGSGSLVDPGGPALGITRDAGGSLSCIDSINSNAGKRLVQGLDVTAVYELPTERWGKFTFSGGYNHFFTWKAEPVVGFGTHSFLGTYNNGTIPLAPGALPWNKGFLRAEWEWHHFDFIATGNYVGDFRDDANFFGPDYFRLYGDVPRNVDSYTTLDLQLSYEWVKPPTEPAPYVKESKDSKNAAPVTEAATASIWQRMLWGTKLTVGVNDVFDRYPPSVLGAFNDNYDTSLYSIRNRYWYVSLTKRF